ncbi:MAG: sialate O-acetylesterase [Actinobacteria bacterium]|nr:MAG: sialate O-acetylesterase [Actinomycetota bacterium]
MRRLVVGGLAVISAAVLGLVLVLVARNHSSEASLPMFIFAGQSNMVGFGAHLEETSPALPTDDSRVLYWDESLRAWSARLPSAGSARTFGPDVTALRRLADRLHEHVLAVKFAVNGSGLAYDWDPSRPDGLYARLRAAVADAIVAPVGRRWPKVNGFFWMQGERDGETPEASAAYETNLRNLITRVRADFGDDKLPVVLGRVRLSEPFATTVRAAQDAAAHRMAKVKTLNTDRLVLAADGVHYDTGAIETLGRQMADAYLTLS